VTIDYDVLRAFEAIEPISGRRRRFNPTEVVSCDTGQAGTTVTIEADAILFLVDLATFKACCKFRNQGSSA
jgi:hypothetical protein